VDEKKKREMTKLKILVTGGAGFIGSHLVEYYSKTGHEVEVLDNLSRAELLKKNVDSALNNWEYLKQNFPKTKFTKGDIRNVRDLSASCKGKDIILHIAAQVAVTTSIVDPKTDFETNAVGTFNVLEAARENDATVVFTSTNKVYGENVNKIPVVEKAKKYEFADPEFSKGISEEFSTDLTGHSPYGSSKYSADIYVQDYAHTYGLRTGIFRMSCIYGERQFGVEDQGWIAWFALSILKGNPINIYGNGKQVRDVLYVSDLVSVFDKFINSKIKHEVFNIGGGYKNTLSLIELLDILKNETKTKPVLYFKDWRTADQKVYISNIDKASRVLNWNPKVNPEQGVKRLFRWFLTNKEKFE
jgi:CDP-paratose 2-epimerase